MFKFSVIASGLDPQADDFEARFYDAGCEDATIAFQKGHIIVDFERKSNSIDEAVSTATAAVIAAGATVDRVFLTLNTLSGDAVIEEVLNKGYQYFTFHGFFFKAEWISRENGDYSYSPVSLSQEHKPQ